MLGKDLFHASVDLGKSIGELEIALKLAAG